MIFLQELDHPKLVFKALQSIGYSGKFLHKPDSPCLYLQDNNGPDGAAIFYKTAKFDLISWTSKVLKVWDVASNQVHFWLLQELKESQPLSVCLFNEKFFQARNFLLSGSNLQASLAAILQQSFSFVLCLSLALSSDRRSL